MNPVLLTAGVLALMAAVIGGGVKAFDIEIPVLTRRSVRAALGTLGIAFLILAVVLSKDGDDGDPAVARYQRQVVATCNAVRRLANRNTIGLPGPGLTFDRDTVLAGGHANLKAIERRLDLLLDKAVPNSLRSEAEVLPRRVDNYVRGLRAVLGAFGEALPPNPTLQQIQTAAAPFEDRADQVRARLEDLMTQLADRDCSLSRT